MRQRQHRAAARFHLPRVAFQVEETIDGRQLKPGGLYYCRARLHPPLVRVRATRQHRRTSSWLDGRLVVLWEDEPEDATDGHRIVVEPWVLSVAPIDQVLLRLRDGAPRRTLTPDAR